MDETEAVMPETKPQTVEEAREVALAEARYACRWADKWQPKLHIADPCEACDRVAEALDALIAAVRIEGPKASYVEWQPQPARRMMVSHCSGGCTHQEPHPETNQCVWPHGCQPVTGEE